MNDNFMRFVLGLIIVIGLSIGGWQLNQYWGKYKEKEPERAPATAYVSGEQLPGLPPDLELPLARARQEGAEALQEFLVAHGNAISDPRLAWIQLDYVVLLAQNSPGEARHEFAKIKSRVPPDSPVYSRVKQLEKTYE
jgi:hypothetical protein